jgi:hypothetical protein
MKLFIKNKFILWLLVTLNVMFACLPVWRSGAMVICRCTGHIIFESMDRNENMACCCNDCGMERKKDVCGSSLCSCASLPASKNFDDHTACFTNAQEYDKTMMCIDYRITQFIDSSQQNKFYPVARYPATGNMTIDILRTTILLI